MTRSLVQTLFQTPWLFQIICIAISIPAAYSTWQRRFGPNGTYRPPGPLGQTLGCMTVLLMAGFAMFVGVVALVVDDSLLSVLGMMLPVGIGVAAGTLVVVLWRWLRH